MAVVHIIVFFFVRSVVDHTDHTGQLATSEGICCQQGRWSRDVFEMVVL